MNWWRCENRELVMRTPFLVLTSLCSRYNHIAWAFISLFSLCLPFTFNCYACSTFSHTKHAKQCLRCWRRCVCKSALNGLWTFVLRHQHSWSGSKETQELRLHSRISIMNWYGFFILLHSVNSSLFSVRFESRALTFNWKKEIKIEKKDRRVLMNCDDVCRCCCLRRYYFSSTCRFSLPTFHFEPLEMTFSFSTWEWTTFLSSSFRLFFNRSDAKKRRNRWISLVHSRTFDLSHHSFWLTCMTNW